MNEFLVDLLVNLDILGFFPTTQDALSHHQDANYTFKNREVRPFNQTFKNATFDWVGGVDPMVVPTLTLPCQKA